MLDKCKNILEKYITLSFNYSVKHMMNLTLLTSVLLSFYYSGAHIWYILWLKIPRITSDMQNDASTYWTSTCGILSSLPISSMRKHFFLIPLSKTNSSALSFYVTKTVLVGTKWFWSDQIDLDLTIMIWSQPKWIGHDQNELVRSKLWFSTKMNHNLDLTNSFW